MRLRMAGHRDQPIVPDPLFLILLALSGFDHADQPAPYYTTGNDGRVHENKDIERIAVLADGGRNEAKIVGKYHALRQDGRQLQTIAIRVIPVFVAAALGRLDDDLEIARLFVVGR